jgi:hypothetical protein
MLRTPFLCALVVTTVVSACQCGEVVQALEADIAVQPESIAFSQSIVGQPSQARLQIGNRGTARLTLSARVEPADQGIEIVAPDEVRAGLAEDATVVFTPLARRAFAADVVITSNDPDTPELRVPVTGEGGPPDVVIEPNPIDFGLVNEGVPRGVSVTLRNQGFDTAGINSIGFAQNVGFTVVDAPGAAPPFALEPGATRAIEVALDVNAAIAQNAIDGVLEDELVVTHADGEERARVTARVNLAPIAVAVEEVTRRSSIKVTIGRVVLVDGSETVDPEGDAFSFTWALVERPAGSTAALIGQGAPETRVTPDVVGRYLVNLRAVDEHGAVGEADLEILPRDLSVVLTWTGEDNDLDLHLIRPGGTLGDYGSCPDGCSEAQCGEFTDDNPTCRSIGTDASFQNRSPEWGALGRVDDPRLDVDDVSGGGPEIISVDQPEDGIWRVVVHHCEDPLVEGGAATVRILEEGIEVFASGPESLGQGDAWSAVTMTRAAGQWEAFIAGPGIVESQPTLCQ